MRDIQAAFEAETNAPAPVTLRGLVPGDVGWVVHRQAVLYTQEYGWDWTYTIEANAFLQHMVRRLVGVLVEVGRGRLTLADFEALFRSAELVGAITLAPPQGLVLDSVRYDR